MNASHVLEIRDLRAAVNGQEILKGVTLTIRSGEIHTVMGPNGSGKSTLCHVLMGHPKYEVTGGVVTFDGEDITALNPDKRAKLGLFLSFQYPQEIPGVRFAHFMRQAKNAILVSQGKTAMNVADFLKLLKEKIKILRFPESFLERSVNEGFSGGEKKRAEILQMAVLEPTFAVLDETDSGLDVDALKTVAKSADAIAKKTHSGVLLITHYQRILNYIEPDFVHIMVEGKIIKTGKREMVEAIEAKGYEPFMAESLATAS